MRRAILTLTRIITLAALVVLLGLSFGQTIYTKWDPSGSDCPVTLPTGATPCPGV